MRGSRKRFSGPCRPRGRPASRAGRISGQLAPGRVAGLPGKTGTAPSCPKTADGAGGEGFDNAAETLFLSPLHSEKYMEIAKFAVDFAAKEYKSRAKILVAKPGPDTSPDQAARTILKTFLPRAFRRPVNESDVAPYLALFRSALKQGQPFESAVAAPCCANAEDESSGAPMTRAPAENTWPRKLRRETSTISIMP